MKYIPHPAFRAEYADGGFVVAHSDLKPTSRELIQCGHADEAEGIVCNIDTVQLASKFEIAARVYSLVTPRIVGEHLLFSFVREDGCEFGISPYKDFYRVSFIGFWNIPFKLDPSDFICYRSGKFLEESFWLPNQMVDFINWVGDLCPLK